jgi:hypothetical protein
MGVSILNQITSFLSLFDFWTVLVFTLFSEVSILFPEMSLLTGIAFLIPFLEVFLPK